MQIIVHKALNAAGDWADYRARCGSRPPGAILAEGDVCWAQDGARRLFYFRHPVAVFDRLSARAVLDRRAAGEVVLLDDVVEQDHPGCTYVMELKIGEGDPRDAALELAERFRRDLGGRGWVDAFGYDLLTALKASDPTASTSIHTELIVGDRLLHWSPQPIAFGLPRIASLAAADTISVRYHLSVAQLGRSVAAIRKAGKRPIVSRIYRPDALAIASAADAEGCYLEPAAFRALRAAD